MNVLIAENFDVLSIHLQAGEEDSNIVVTKISL